MEAKLVAVRQEWSFRSFQVGPINGRQVLGLVSADTADLLSSLDEAQITLSALQGSRCGRNHACGKDVPCECVPAVAMLRVCRVANVSLALWLACQNSRYHLPFARELAVWVRRLAIVADVLEPWVRIQASFLYLEAVFNSGDIAVQLPVEARRFANATRVWSRLMARVSAQPAVLQVCCNSDTVRQALPPLWTQLERCQVALAGYLAAKRDAFPRFCFVSDAVLLEVLARGTANPASVAKHLPAIADGPAMLMFDHTRRSNVIGVMGASGEELRFPGHRVVVAEGPVETWLASLLDTVSGSVAVHLSRALTVASAAAHTGLSFQQAYQQVLEDATPLAVQKQEAAAHAASQEHDTGGGGGTIGEAQWLEDFPMQLCVISYRVLWTALTERALRAHGRGSDPHALSALHEYMRVRMSEVVDAARERQEPLPEAGSAPPAVVARAAAARRRRHVTVSALVTVQTHHRDVCAVLAKERPRGTESFAWRRHLRSYYDVRAHVAVRRRDWRAYVPVHSPCNADAPCADLTS